MTTSNLDSCRHSTDLRKKFLKEKELTRVKIQEISRASDLEELHSTKMDERKGTSQEQEYTYKTENNKPQKKQYHPQTQPKTTVKKPKVVCFRCGYADHSGYRCMRSHNVVCSVCHRKNTSCQEDATV